MQNKKLNKTSSNAKLVKTPEVKAEKHVRDSIEHEKAMQQQKEERKRRDILCIPMKILRLDYLRNA